MSDTATKLLHYALYISNMVKVLYYIINLLNLNLLVAFFLIKLLMIKQNKKMTRKLDVILFSEGNCILVEVGSWRGDFILLLRKFLSYEGG